MVLLLAQRAASEGPRWTRAVRTNEAALPAKQGEWIDERSLETVLVRCAQSKAFRHPPQEEKTLGRAGWGLARLPPSERGVRLGNARLNDDAH